MNILLDDLPTSVYLADPDPPYYEREYPINSDFRTGIKFSVLMEDEDLDDEEKAIRALELYYDQIPVQVQGAYDALIQFYCCNQEPKEDQKAEVPLFSYGQDAPYIFAAFWQQYRIDLTEADMHWFKFKALFDALDDKTQFMKIVSYRAWKPYEGCSSEEKSEMRKLQKHYALRTKQTREAERQHDELLKALESGDMTAYNEKYLRKEGEDGKHAEIQDGS